jgi:hypothetical protein
MPFAIAVSHSGVRPRSGSSSASHATGSGDAVGVGEGRVAVADALGPASPRSGSLVHASRPPAARPSAPRSTDRRAISGSDGTIERWFRAGIGRSP